MLDQRGHVLPARDVGLAEGRLSTSAFDLLGENTQTRCVSVGQDDLRCAAGEDPRRFGADPRGRAGHDNDFVAK